MNVFLQIHRSIFETTFYREVISLGRKKIISYLVTICAIAAFCIASVQTYRIINTNTGLPYLLPQLFPSMEISRNGMISHADKPYSINKFSVAELFSILSDINLSGLQLPDSVIVVDEGFNKQALDSAVSKIIFAQSSIYFNFKPEFEWELPYDLVLKKDEVVYFTTESLRTFFLSRAPFIFIGLFLRYGATIFFMMFMSIFFLSIAAYIFKSNQPISFKTVLKIASFAVTPVLVGVLLNNVSGIKVAWMWEVSLFISLFIIIRVLFFLSGRNNEERITGDEP
ncbi:MAG: DUF1189 family protein [Chitinivibrionales bacterium]|nr:DUF1189 family protein [Chitinivibrionales bacterium]